ncbi:hypothetical protein A176_004552 [Myxococcus hansupus]|uniref:Uncharacterized protein n=1 Tax=Pseudomyxococcus hansupus TaxID=1297742 RepID=A0A0H4X1W3_9BACT|nr:hypothetical protein A176_004552 [Myxococcus hansupus]
MAVNGTLNNLLGYPIKKRVLWPQYISVSPEEIQAVHARWRKADPQSKWATPP